MRVRLKEMPLPRWLRRETAPSSLRPGRGNAVSKCACAGQTAWREAEGVARGSSAHPCARQEQPIPSLRELVEKAGGERHCPVWGAGAKGAIPLARDLTSQ